MHDIMLAIREINIATTLCFRHIFLKNTRGLAVVVAWFIIYAVFVGILPGYVWTESATAKIFSRFQIYTGTCGRGPSGLCSYTTRVSGITVLLYTQALVEIKHNANDLKENYFKNSQWLF